MNKKGVTLIELIIFIIVGGMFIPLAYISFTALTSNLVRPETAAMIKAIAETKINDINSTAFDSIVSSASYSNVTDDARFQRPSPNPYDGYKWRWEVTKIAYNRTTDISGNTTITIGIPEGWQAQGSKLYFIGDYIKVGDYFYRMYFPTWSINWDYGIKSTNFDILQHTRVDNGTYYKLIKPPAWQSDQNYAIGTYVSPHTSTGYGNYYYRLIQKNENNSHSQPTWTGTTDEEVWDRYEQCVWIFCWWVNAMKWKEATAEYKKYIAGDTKPTCSGAASTCFDGKLWWQYDEPHPLNQSISTSPPSFPSITSNGYEVVDNNIRWKESTAYKQIKIYVKATGYSIEYMFSTIIAAKDYTPVTGRP